MECAGLRRSGFPGAARSHRFAFRSHLLAVLLAGTKNRFSARYNFLPYLHLNKCLPKISEESLNKFCFRMSSSQKGVDKYYHWVCTFLCCCQFCAEISRGVKCAVSVSDIGLLQQIKSVLQYNFCLCGMYRTQHKNPAENVKRRHNFSTFHKNYLQHKIPALKVKIQILIGFWADRMYFQTHYYIMIFKSNGSVK